MITKQKSETQLLKSARKLIAVAAGLLITFGAHAQWTTSGTAIYNTNSGNVGIGTTTPTAKLHLTATGASWTTSGWGKTIELPNGSVFKWAANASGYRFGLGQSTSGLYFVRSTVDDNSASPVYDMFISNGGNVGVGTTSPFSSARLHVKSVDGSGWGIVSEANANQKIIGLGHDGSAGNISVSYLDGSGFTPLNLNTSNLTRLSIAVNGYIGIGTTSPDQLLTVKGITHSQEVRVDLSVPGPDYVFDPEYKLLSLRQIKTYIHLNRHLPEVPSAAEMEKNGLQLGEMNVLLLKKVEELTLHLIELEDRLTKMEEQRIQAGEVDHH